MAVERSVSLVQLLRSHPAPRTWLAGRRVEQGFKRGGWVAVLDANLATLACSAPAADGQPDYDGAPPFSPAGAGSNAQSPAGPNAPANTGGSTGGASSGEGNLSGVNAPGSNGAASNIGSVTPTGAGGATMVTPSGGAGGAAGSGTGGVSGVAGAGNLAGTLPTPPGEAFFFDDFEAGAPGLQPAAWARWINYTTVAGNTLEGAQFALLDDQEAFRGNQSVHFHVEGATQPAMLTMTLPANMTRIYVRAFVKTSVQIGNQTPDQQSNHESLIGLRAIPNDGNFEIRFGGAKGSLGFNMVGPGRNDAVAPPQALWGSAPSIPVDTWRCLELAFLNDNAASPVARASVDDQVVRSVTAASDWHVPLGNASWLTGMFTEVFLGWQSFSPAPANDVWMDDVVLSTEPIGCD